MNFKVIIMMLLDRSHIVSFLYGLLRHYHLHMN